MEAGRESRRVGAETGIEFVVWEDGATCRVGSGEDAASFLASAGLGRSGYLYMSIDVVPADDGSFRGILTAFSGNRFRIFYPAAHQSAKWIGNWLGSMEGECVRRDNAGSEWDVLAERREHVVAPEI